MHESNLKITTQKEYTLEELYKLFEAEGQFGEPYTLVTEKCLTKHIRFPALSKTAIEVYPAGRKIVVNLTKDNRGKDLAISVLTDGWSDILSSAKEKNEPLFMKIYDEVRRLVALDAGAPAQAAPAQAASAPPEPAAPAPPPAPPVPPAQPPEPQLPEGALKQTEIYSGFVTIRLTAYEDRIEMFNVKKGTTKVMPYDRMAKAVARKDTLTVTMADGDVEPFVFRTSEECAAWDGIVSPKCTNTKPQNDGYKSFIKKVWRKENGKPE